MMYKAKDGMYLRAVQITADAAEQMKELLKGCSSYSFDGSTFTLSTDHGPMVAHVGDYVVCTKDGCPSLISSEVMQKAFEAVIVPKAMLSQPMRGVSETEIAATRDRAIKYLESKGYEVVNTLFTDEWYSQDAMKERGVRQIPICFLAKSIDNMSRCDAAFFCVGWEKARGCVIEHEVAKQYGLTIIYESEIIKEEVTDNG